MIDYDALRAAMPDPDRKGKGKKKPASNGAPLREMAKRTYIEPEAPAPRLAEVVAQRGQEPTARALAAWHARVDGVPIIEVAHQLAVPIALAKKLIGEVHSAIHEDLKEALDQNRQLDLARVDGIINTFYPQAKAGDVEGANVTLRALQHRAKLCGIEPLPDPGRSHPQNVLIWMQQQLPNINKIVDSFPLELPPSAP